MGWRCDEVTECAGEEVEFKDATNDLLSLIFN